MVHTESNREPIDELAEEFAERQRRGEGPTVKEYVEKYPDLADEIRELFPALQFMEELKPEAGDVPSAPPEFSVPVQSPKLLGDYRILREVGRGGMGTVYEAEQQSLGRRVALKVLPHHLLVSEKQKKRFEHEARAAARLHHTNIVPVFGIGQDDGVYYYVMQFIQGQGLDEVLVEVRRLRDRDRGQQMQKRTGNTGRLLDEPVTQLSREASPSATVAERVALSMVTGQFEGKQLLDSSGSLSDKTPTPVEQMEQSFEATEVACSEHRHKAGVDRAATLSSSSLTLLDADGSGRWSRSRAMYYRSVARSGAQAADALHYAHEQGVLHRDVKPSNLMLDAQGTLWVTDFGLAKAEDQQSLTQTGDIVGTLRYMAPEMFSGRADARSDICELGLTLYEMLALRPAFDESDRGRLVRQVMNESPPRLDTLDRHLPRDLVTIVHKAIDHEPATRYRTAAELRDDLNRFLLDEPVKARRISFTSRCGRWCKRNPAIASLTGIVATLLLVGAIASSAIAYRLGMLVDELGEKKTEAEVAQEESLRNLWDSYLSQARASRWSGRSGQRFDSFDALTRAAALIPRLGLGDEAVMELRNEAVACMALVDLRVTGEWTCPTQEHLFAVDFSPDLRFYAGPDAEGNVFIRSITDADDDIHLPAEGTPYVLQFSPDGRLLLVSCLQGDACAITLWDWVSQEVVLKTTDDCFGNSSFSPDCQQLAVDTDDGSIRIYDVATGKESSRFLPTFPPAHICFHPDGRRLAVSSESGESVEIWDLETRSVLHHLAHHQKVRGIDWRADGTLLAAACHDGSIHLWNGNSGTHQSVLKGHKSPAHWVTFHPTLNLLVSHSWDGTTRVWNLADGRQLVVVEGYYIRFGPEGRYLAFRDGRQIGLWEVGDAAECKMTCKPDGTVDDFQNVDFSPDGRLLASGSTLGIGPRLWDMETFRQVAILPTGATLAVGFNPADGSLIAGGNRGLYKWPITPHEHTADALQIGPPVPLDWPRGVTPSRLDFTADGSVLAVDESFGAKTVLLRRGKKELPIFASTKDRAYVAIAPDGRWVATGNYKGSDVEVWDAQTGKLVCTLPHTGTTLVAFSPDSRWLVTAGTKYQFWETGSWQLLRSMQGVAELGGRLAFSPDGTVLAITVSRNEVQLVDVDTNRVLAQLAPTPKPSRVQWLCFSPDGSQLATACGSEGVRVWDLRRIRKQLATMHLDWDMPPYPPVDQVANLKPLEAKVDLGHLAGAAQQKNNQAQANAGDVLRMLEAATKAIELHDGDTEALRRRAEACIPLKLYGQAIADCSKVLELEPDDLSTRKRRAYAHTKLEQWADALQDYTECIKQDPEAVIARSNRAYVHRQLGQLEDALLDYDEVLSRDPNRYSDWYELALVQLAAGDTDGYQQACAELLEGFRETTDPKAASYVAWTCVLSSTSEADWSALAAVAERATEPADGDCSLGQAALGAALYRAGRFDEAVVQLTEADRQIQAAGPSAAACPAYAWLFLALAQHELNHQDEARQWFEKAVEWKKQYVAGDPQGDQPTIPWVRQVTLDLLEKEAGMVFDG